MLRFSILRFKDGLESCVKVGRESVVVGGVAYILKQSWLKQIKEKIMKHTVVNIAILKKLGHWFTWWDR